MNWYQQAQKCKYHLGHTENSNFAIKTDFTNTLFRAQSALKQSNSSFPGFSNQYGEVLSHNEVIFDSTLPQLK